MTVQRFRNFTMLLWPDSMPEGSIEKLLNSDMSVIISPLHQPEKVDFDEDKGKPHYHVIISFDGPKSYQAINDRMMTEFHCNPIKPVDNMSSMARYLIHRGWNRKIQYDFKDLQYNYDVRKYYAEDTFVMDILNYIEVNQIKTYKNLVHSLFNLRKFDYVEKVAKMAYFFKQLFE